MNMQGMVRRMRKVVIGAAAAAVMFSALLPGAQPAQASSGLSLAVYDAESTSWYSYRNMSEAGFDAQFAEKAGAGYMLVDIEIDVVSGARRVGAIWQKNADSRGWVAHYKKTHAEFSAKWQEYKDAGFRLVDQETYVLNGTRYWAGIWIENKEGAGWASYRNASSADFSAKFDTYSGAGYIPVDVEAYKYGSGVAYSAAWVQNTDGLGWILRRDMSEAQYADYFQQYKDTFRVMDLESYVRNGQQNFAAIWVENSDGRGWYAYRDMSFDGFTNRWNQLWDAGYRLVDYDVYLNAANQRRYLGVWRQNTDRPDWPLKDQVTSIVQAEVDNFNVPGMSVAIAHKGQLVYLRGFGNADVAADRWAHSRTVYRLASISKAIAGVLTLQVVDQAPGFALSDPTRDWAPSLPNHHTHTVGQLAAMRGGIGHYAEHGDTNADFATALAGAGFFQNDPLAYTPGTSAKYSTHSYTLLGAALEGATGDNIDDIVWDNLSAPFGLSSLRVERWSTPVANRSTLYDTDNSVLTPDNTTWKVLGGGLEGSAYDLARLGVKLIDEQILDAAALNTLWSPFDGLSSYGLGWDTGTESGTPVVFKAGGWHGSNTFIRMYPDKEIVVVVLSNRWKGDHSAGKVAGEIGALMLANEAILNPITLNPALPTLPIFDEPEPTVIEVVKPGGPILEVLPAPPEQGGEETPAPGEDAASLPMPEEDLPLKAPTAQPPVFLPLIRTQ
jgi:CubicO group peptidase (beta-lactamase class C family)